MAGDKHEASWSLPKFCSDVDIKDVGEKLQFQEVSGLDVETQIIEYRAGGSKPFAPNKMPGLLKFGHVTLKKGIFAEDDRFWDWLQKVKMNTIKRSTVTIRLLDESGAPAMTWTLTNAWPTKITATDLKADGNEVAVESVEIAHEGVTVANT